MHDQIPFFLALRSSVRQFQRPFEGLSFTVEPLAATTSRKRPPLLSDQFPKYQKLPSQIITFGTSCKRPPLISNRNHF